MPRRRIQRLNEQLKREISRILRREVRDPRVGTVTVTGVEVSSDVSVARVFVRSLGDEDEQEATMEGLHAAAAHVRSELGKSLHLRHIPEIRFQRDRTLEKARRIEAILDEVRPDGGWEEGEGERGGGVDVPGDERGSGG